ncbi:MAG TPA: TRAP transporter large permease [Aminivibrio sp.]|jgi:C4-dicarboxylate transporter DctM subunit|uniref:TRAP transporter large permease n=1 Tax=Aminivibrio sp. TaxID=1872489 RepID=UPI002CC76AF2|nr:TRAP transporter large permease [Aminivibrio sp.]NCB14979.1 TRAP transporter large permease [Synergistales bacterium]HPF85857.1 TRAP transporter large permease [Aminivibrio sp.]
MTYLMTAAFLVCFFMGIPLALVMGITGIVVLIAMGVPLEVVAQRMFTGIDSFPLMAVPFFILAGDLMNRGGTTVRIIGFANSLVGHIRGGLAHACVVANMIFAGISGSSVADASAIGSIMIPSMEKSGYDLDFSAALNSVAATIGPIIPPSIIMVIYGVSVNVSVGGLFAAGFVPGILMGLALMIVVTRVAKKKNYPTSEGFSGKRVAAEFRSSVWALMAPIIILGGILGGVFTPTEAAAVAVIYSFFVGKFIFREIAWKDVPHILFQSGITTGAILLIISLANVFAWVIAANQVPVKLSALFLSATSNPYVFLLIVNILLLIVGMFMETGAAIILLAPILAPIAAKLGINPLHFGFMMVLNLAIGMATPPVGVCLFVSCGITGLSLEKVSAAAMRFVLALLGVLLLVTYVAPISLFLPKLLGFIR